MAHTSPADNYLFVGTHGHVVALDQHDGTLVWKTSLPKTGWAVVVMLVENGRLLCGTAGRVFALDPVDGSVLWENGLPGMGQGVVALSTLKQAPDFSGAAAAQEAANQSAHAGTHT